MEFGHSVEDLMEDEIFLFLSHSDILKSGFHNMVASDVRVIFFTVIFWVDDIA